MQRFVHFLHHLHPLRSAQQYSAEENAAFCLPELNHWHLGVHHRRNGLYRLICGPRGLPCAYWLLRGRLLSWLHLSDINVYVLNRSRKFLNIPDGRLTHSLSDYKRHELQWRVNLFFCASIIAGAFSGLLAYAIAHMDGIAGYSGWRWIL